MPPRKRSTPSRFQHPPIDSSRYKKRTAPLLPGPLMTENYVRSSYPPVGAAAGLLGQPKDTILKYVTKRNLNEPTPSTATGFYDGKSHFRVTLTVEDGPNTITGIGDGPSKRAAEKVAYMSAVLQLGRSGLLDQVFASGYVPPTSETVLRDGTKLDVKRAQLFMEFYCMRYNFPPPEITTKDSRGKWEAILSVGDRRIGIGRGSTKKLATSNSHLDVVRYIDSCDPDLWPAFLIETKNKGDALGLAPPVWLNASGRLGDKLKDLNHELSRSKLYSNRPQPLTRDDTALISDSEATSSSSSVDPEPSSFDPRPSSASRYRGPDEVSYQNKSRRLKEALGSYLSDPAQAKMREQRHALPVFTRSSELLDLVESHDVTICMAATGSGKTTQIPQMILDSYIARGEGSRCNIICTQPRRIAAISVAERVAKERGQVLGNQIGYQVRFDAKLPMNHGSITFCTTGIFLKRMQSALDDILSLRDDRSIDDVTHLIIDEVHERDVDTDLTLVVLKRLLEDRRARGKPLKIVLMSATIDPTLFQQYFADINGQPAPIIDIPGRSFPVEKHYLEDVLTQLSQPEVDVGRRSSWLFGERSVTEYIGREIGQSAVAALRGQGPGHVLTASASLTRETGENLEIPFGLVALIIAHVLRKSNSGHVLVFLPGWEEITAVQRILLDPGRFPLLGMNLGNAEKYSLHLLHSSVPVAEQQAVFEPAPDGVRRIILATNIAETSITIPDVVYVVDTGKVKEKRYDPERHMSSLVSAWVGTSNLNQRAGRAGRHRPGQYYGLVSTTRLAMLDPYQTVEMKRADLSNVVMHVKALDFPGMQIEGIFSSLIEPPSPERVRAALETLQVVGALDDSERLTSLGRVLLQLPIEAAMGRLVLYGCLFKCLDSALTLAAILTNREPFLAPVSLKQEANAVKESWAPKEVRSDPLAALQAYNAWWGKQSCGEYIEANQFCNKNFLSKPTLLMIEKVRSSLLQSLLDAGVIDVSAGGRVSTSFAKARSISNSKWRRKISSGTEIPPELNVNNDSLPVLTSLIALASQPNFATRTSERIYRTPQDKTTFIHPSSVNSPKKDSIVSATNNPLFGKHILTFTEKVRNVSVASTATNAQTFLRNTTRLDIITYLLFGAYQVRHAENGLECDDWLPVQGGQYLLERAQELKSLLEACMLRVFAGISAANSLKLQDRIMRSQVRSALKNDDDADGTGEQDRDDDDQDDKATPLDQEEIVEIDLLTNDVVEILEMFSEERIASQSRRTSRPNTPISLRPSPSMGAAPLPNVGAGSAFTQGIRQMLANRSGPGTPHHSRPQTPLRESHTRS